MSKQERKDMILATLKGAPVSYLAIWSIANRLGVDLLDFGGVGLADTEWTAALRELEEEGKIEELKDLSYRYRLVSQ